MIYVIDTIKVILKRFRIKNHHNHLNHKNHSSDNNYITNEPLTIKSFSNKSPTLKLVPATIGESLSANGCPP
jgi:hypothetical protein